MIGWVAVGIMLLAALLLGFSVGALFSDNAYERGRREGFRDYQRERSDW